MAVEHDEEAVVDMMRENEMHVSPESVAETRETLASSPKNTSKLAERLARGREIHQKLGDMLELHDSVMDKKHPAMLSSEEKESEARENHPGAPELTETMGVGQLFPAPAFDPTSDRYAKRGFGRPGRNARAIERVLEENELVKMC